MTGKDSPNNGNRDLVIGVAILLALAAGIAGAYLLVDNRAEWAKEQLLEHFLSRNDAPNRVAESYRFALENPENVMERVNCYCGSRCSKNFTHESNRDCFVNDRDEWQGSGVFDEHGLKGGTCVATVLYVKKKYRENYSPETIAEMVENRFKDSSC